jgi:NAD dependent epimerase/dehydratase
MKWQDKRILVTGAGGFIGSHLVDELLSRGADVTAFVHYNARNDWGMLEGRYNENTPHLKVIAGDITDSLFVQKAVSGKDFVFHLAALIGIPYSYTAPESYINTNVKGSLNVMQACLDADVERVVHTSTSEVYGTAQYTPIDENHPLCGQSPYSASKIGADKIAESYNCSFGLPVIPTIITQALKSDTVKLGSLTPIRDLTFVADTVQGFIKIAESKKSIGKTINTGTGRGVSIGELAELILDLVNPQARIVCEQVRVRPKNSEVMQLLCDNRVAKDLAGWQPEFTLERGLSLTIEWMKEHITSYKPGHYTV